LILSPVKAASSTYTRRTGVAFVFVYVCKADMHNEYCDS
jgi:hypothetical protein